MALCKFFQQGYCKFGNSCRYEHVNAGGNRSQPSSNRFGSLGGNNTSQADATLSKYNLSPDVLEKDLTTEAPQWILSAYAPGRDAPDQLFGGYPREQSFEELRLHYMTGKASGNEQQALNEAQQLWQNAKQQMDNAARNPNEAIQFIVGGENRHPNRHDICTQGTQGAPFGEFLVGKRPNPAANAFGGNTSMTTTTSSFGQPSALGQASNPFGAPSRSTFGQPSQPTFGQPSQPTSAFGQAAQAASTFGQPSQPTSAFGQPSMLGAKPSAFGAPAFGQASQPNVQSNPFGQPSHPQQTQGSAFGQPTQLGQKPNPFGSSTSAGPSAFASVGNNATPAANPFGGSSISQGSTTSSPFGSTTANQPNNAPSSFGQPAASTAFGQPSAPAANPFGAAPQGPASNAANPFGQQTSQQQSPFGAPTNQNSGTSFGQNTASSFGQQQQPSANPFGQAQTSGAPSQPNPFGANQQPQAATGGNNPYPPTSKRQHPPVESYSSKLMDGRLAQFKGKPVTYKDGQPGIKEFNGTWTRIWFPNGPPGYNRDTELALEEYSDAVKAQWNKFGQTGTFADGLMPELPPPRVCTRWDF